MKPPLELSHTITGASGRKFRAGPSSAKPGDRPLDFSFETEAGEGFAGASLAFRRNYAGDYPDTDPLNELVAMGADGRTAYEGRSQGPTRSIDAGGSQVRLDFQGWMSHARQRQFCELAIDADVSNWRELDSSFVAFLINGGWTVNKSYTASMDDGMVTFSGDKGSAIPYLAFTGALYGAPPGTKVAGMSFAGTTANASPALGPDLRTGPTADTIGGSVYPTFDGVRRTIALTPGRFLGSLVIANTSPSHTPTNPLLAQMKNIQVIGDHGLAAVSRGDGMIGIGLTDLLVWLFNKYAPKIDTSQVQRNPYAVAHAVWRDLTNTQEAAKALNSYAQWAMGVWENHRLEHRPVDLSVADWQVQAGFDGVEVENPGQTVDDAWNGAIVTYTDFTGTEQTLTPNDAADLADTNPAIAANQWGDEAWLPINLSGMRSSQDAVFIARARLLEINRPKFPSTITLTGHVRDGRGQWQQGWLPRANQTIRITNHPNDIPRLITKTSWAGNKLTITTDNALNRMDAVESRRQMARTAGGIS